MTDAIKTAKAVERERVMDTREAVARAMYQRHFTVATWENARDKLQATYFAEADAAIAAHLKSLADAGYVVVPREPTDG